MKESYGYNQFFRFIVNRVLRLYPAYFVSILFSIILLLIFGGSISSFKSQIRFPAELVDWSRNIFIFLEPGSSAPFSPSAWALTVELFFYFAIGLGLSRSLVITWLWVFVSFIYTLAMLWGDHQNWQSRYFSIYAASLPFSVGSVLYYYKEIIYSKLKKFRLKNGSFWFLALNANFLIFYVCNSLLAFDFVRTFGQYFNLIIVSVLIVVVSFDGLFFCTKKLDQALGKFSYPMYLLHWQVGALVSVIFFNAEKPKFLTLSGGLFVFVSLLLVLVFSF